MSQLAVRLLKGHKASCAYLRAENGGRPRWFLNTYEHAGGASHAYRSKMGRKHKHGRSRWLMLICADTQCTAEAIVRVDSIEDAVQDALG